MDIQHGPPYVPTTAGYGGRPTLEQDIPALAVFTAIYLIGAITHMTIFQTNRLKGHKFLMSWAMFGFCMARIATCVLRIAWATHLYSPGLAIAANIFLSVGIIVAYVVVLILAARIFRATHPGLARNKKLDKVLAVLHVGLAIAVILVISFTITTFYTLNTTIRTVALWMQRGSILYMLIFNCVSTILLLASVFLPQEGDRKNFGTGSMRSKILILGVADFFCLFIAGFRCGVAWTTPRPVSDPAWYDSKAVFYLILLGFEIVIIYLFIFTRFDQRFWIPSRELSEARVVGLGHGQEKDIDEESQSSRV